MQRLSKKHAILILVVGVLFLAVAVFAWIKTVHYRGEGVHADAVITDIETTYFDDDTDHTVTVRFTTEDGEEITGELDAYQSGFYVGKTVPVLYLPDDPHKFTYAKNGLLLPLIFIGAGVFLLGFGVFALVRKDRGYDDGTDYTPDDASGA
ncbi:MAG: DUF3592 domain-containing protein [Clostridia bacterium]|nr:DUF3592 domain-containing protein [Clostridia bacterium]